jgi:hypothetical protein
VKQDLAGLDREGWELELGYQFPLNFRWIKSVQPAARYSVIDNHYLGTVFPSPSVWWDWRKLDAGVRVGLPHGLDVTAEYTTHDITSRFPLELKEWLVTVRWRV